MTLTVPPGHDHDPVAEFERYGAEPAREDLVIARRREPQLDAAPWVLVGVSALVALLDLGIPVLRPLAGLVLLATPGWALYRRLRWPFDTRAHALCAVLGLTVLGCIVGGLLLNTVLPWTGVERPLAARPVTVTAVVVALGALAWRPSVPLLTGDPRAAAQRLAGLRFRLVPTLAVANVVVAAVGAVRLNNGAGGGLAVAGHVGVALLMAIVLLARTDDLRRDAVAVYASGLSLLLATSLRSWYVSGHDVQREWMSFQLVHGSGVWDMSVYRTAYHACLSVNILPTVVADLTGLSGVVVFKLVLQLVAAALVVVVLLLARTVLDHRMAVAAAAVFTGFPTFSGDMPYLVRQEIAFLFFGLALLMAAQKGFSVRARRALVVVFGVGVVLSHYSTTYLTIATIFFGFATLHALAWGERRWALRRGRPAPPPSAEPLVVLHPSVFVSLLVATFVWVYPVTDSGGHLFDTLKESVANVVSGDGGPGSTDVSFSIVPGQQKATPQERLDLFAEQALEARDDAPELPYLLPVNQRMSEPQAVEADPEPLTGLGERVQGVVPVKTVNSVLRLGSALGLQVLVLVGLAALVLRRARGTSGLTDPDRALMVGALGGIAMVVVVPGLSAEYGVLRAFQQGFVLLAPVVVAGALTLIGLVKPLARIATGLVAAGAVGLILVLTGVVSTVTGGYTGVLALSNTGPYMQLHYLSSAEVAGYRWLGLNAGGRIVQAEVISDKLAAYRLQYHPQGGVLVANDMYPSQLIKGSVVFLGPDTVRDGTAAEFYTGTLVDYAYPVGQLERRLDVVFSSPDARILWPTGGQP